MSYSEKFSENYITARERFRTVSSDLGYQYTAYPIGQTGPAGEDLTIDVVVRGSENPRRVVIISSGLHGVEGFLGSAIQLALLEEQRTIQLALSANIKVIFIHALNPYGFAWERRWNEDNIDLNRNFLLPGEDFKGSPERYSKFDSFLNSATPPFKFEPYSLQALWLILRYGMSSLKIHFPWDNMIFQKGFSLGGMGLLKRKKS